MKKIAFLALLIILIGVGCVANDVEKVDDVVTLGPPDNSDFMPAFKYIEEPNELIGDYDVIEGDYESMIMAEDGRWYTHLHARPFYDGEWTFENGLLIFESISFDEPRVYNHVVMEEGLIILENDGDQREVWQPVND
jgi:hypothetical protein